MNCYNSDQFLKEAIDSIYAQTYSNWEIIFWDNASTDDSAIIAKSYDYRLKYYLANETTPLGEARNLAIQKATGEYIAFLDCDDLYLPSKLEKQIQLMGNADYAMCYGSSLTIDCDGNSVRKTKVKNRSGYLFPDLLKHYEISMVSVMLRRSMLVDSGLFFLSNLQYSPDYNLFMNIAAVRNIAVVPDYVVKYRILTTSLSSKTMHVAPLEVKYTLDEIIEKFPEFINKFPSELKQAYAKVHYYKAVYYLFNKKRYQAALQVKKILFVRYEYFVIFCALLTPLPSTVILKLLRRA